MIEYIAMTALYILGCLIAGFFGRKRRIGFWGFVFASYIFTPIVTLLFLFFTTVKKKKIYNS